MHTHDEQLTCASQLIEHARLRGLHIACAESCTAGMLSSTIAAVSGASDVLLGGIVSYAVSVKRDVLGVSQETLNNYGVYSFQCAEEMAQGVRALLKAEVGVGITGVAGPGPSEEGISAGHVWIAVEAQTSCRHPLKRHYLFEGTRDDVRKQATLAALELLDEAIVNMQNDT
ncbi:MAG: CinA family protein [Atopobiaceae bacterium]|nr:CinA family protein [Atopobiaceae bacterium]